MINLDDYPGFLRFDRNDDLFTEKHLKTDHRK
jgi:hypothetical protein